MPNMDTSQQPDELETEDQPEGQVGDEEVPEESEGQPETEDAPEEPAPKEPADSQPDQANAQLQQIQQQLGFLMQTVQGLQQNRQPPQPANFQPQTRPNLEDMDRNQLVDYIANMNTNMTGKQMAQVQQWMSRQFANIGAIIDSIASDNPKYKDALAATQLMTQNPGLTFQVAMNQTKVARLEQENRDLRKQQKKTEKHIDKRKQQVSNRQPPTPHAPVMRKNPSGQELNQEQRKDLFFENARKLGIKLDAD